MRILYTAYPGKRPVEVNNVIDLTALCNTASPPYPEVRRKEIMERLAWFIIKFLIEKKIMETYVLSEFLSDVVGFGKFEVGRDE